MRTVRLLRRAVLVSALGLAAYMAPATTHYTLAHASGCQDSPTYTDNPTSVLRPSYGDTASITFDIRPSGCGGWQSMTYDFNWGDGWVDSGRTACSTAPCGLSNQPVTVSGHQYPSGTSTTYYPTVTVHVNTTTGPLNLGPFSAGSFQTIGCPPSCTPVHL